MTIVEQETGATPIEEVRGRCRSLVRAAERLQRRVFQRQPWNGPRTLGRFPQEHEAMMDGFFQAIEMDVLAIIQGGKKMVPQRVNALATLTGKMLSAVPNYRGCVHGRVIGPFDAEHEPLMRRVIEALRPFLGPLYVRIDDHRMAPGIMKVLVCGWGGGE